MIKATVSAVFVSLVVLLALFHVYCFMLYFIEEINRVRVYDLLRSNVRSCKQEVVWRNAPQFQSVA